MEQNGALERSANRRVDASDAAAIALSSRSRAAATVSPQIGGGSCGCASAAADNSNGADTTAYVYAIGRVELRFPSLGLEKEFAQATGRSDTAGLTDREATHSVLSEGASRYLLRQLCWVLTIEGLETYILVPRDPGDYDLLLEAFRANPSSEDKDCVIGVRGPVAPPEMCNGLQVPIVAFDQIYSFDRVTLVKNIPRPETVAAKQEKQFRSASGELFDRLMQIADNAGATDEHRAVNYLAVRYAKIYEMATQMYSENSSLSLVEVQPSRLSGVRNIVAVIFAFTNRQTDVTKKYFVRVDVTEEFPFLVTKLSEYYDR